LTQLVPIVVQLSGGVVPPELDPPELDPPELDPPELEPPELEPPELDPPLLEDDDDELDEPPLLLLLVDEPPFDEGGAVTWPSPSPPDPSSVEGSVELLSLVESVGEDAVVQANRAPAARKGRMKERMTTLGTGRAPRSSL
jgi:hypothetical protein